MTHLDGEACVCATPFTCMADEHDDPVGPEGSDCLWVGCSHPRISGTARCAFHTPGEHAPGCTHAHYEAIALLPILTGAVVRLGVNVEFQCGDCGAPRSEESTDA